MYCEFCGSNDHDSTTAGCPLGKATEYIRQDEVVERFTNPDTPKVEKQILKVLKEIKDELDKIRKMLATKIPPW